jgi:hypothetical protein
MIELDKYEPVNVPCIGKKYHVVWAHNGVVGVCYEINGDRVKLMTPKTRMPFKHPVPVSQLRHLKQRSFRLKNGSTEEKENAGVPDCSKNLWKKIKPKQ